MSVLGTASRPVFWLDLAALSQFAGGVAETAGARGQALTFEELYAPGADGLDCLYGELVAAGVVQVIGADPHDLHVIEDEWGNPAPALHTSTGDVVGHRLRLRDVLGNDRTPSRRTLEHQLAGLADRLIGVANLLAREARRTADL
ncbi:MAG: hypothetical protein QOJ13_1222 [Gaiellales bacterium]|jgi:hypothetical protein|nr:hypothetical protein [Gaiellales bacterium]